MKTIALLYGGKSPEHEISIKTAASVWKHLLKTNYEIIPYYIELSGKWKKGEKNSSPLEWEKFTSLSYPMFENIDGVFPLLHGPYGEDGSIQGFFETIDIPYVGCGVFSSAIGMDKVATRQLLAYLQIPQVRFLYISNVEFQMEPNAFVTEVKQKLGFPCFVKPSSQGSSIGIVKVSEEQELFFAIQQAFQFNERVLVEEAISGRELEIGILGRGKNIQTSVVGEISSSSTFYDYDTKYKNKNAKLQIPTFIPLEVEQEIRNYAKKIFLEMTGSGLARVDFLWDSKNARLYLNEINTMPGFTESSMYPKLWEASGVTYPELLKTLLELSWEEHQYKKQFSKNQKIYDTIK